MYIPESWIIDKENNDKVFEILETISEFMDKEEEESIAKQLSDLGETILLEKYNSGELIM